MILFALNCCAQNLVSNGGFENYYSIPTADGEITKCVNWTSGGKSPDYLHQNALIVCGMNIPYSVYGTLPQTDGQACAGIAGYVEGFYNYHEFLSYKLDFPLTTGSWYAVKMRVFTHLNPMYYGGVVTDGWGVAFTKKKLNNPIGLTPQCLYGQQLYSPNWSELTFTLYADSAYKFITIGNFLPDSLQSRHVVDTNVLFTCAYVFIDNVSVEKIIGAGIVEIDRNAIKKELYYNLLGQKTK